MSKIIASTGTEADFFKRGLAIAKAADKGQAIKETHAITFEDPQALLAFLTPKRLGLLQALRKEAASITRLAERVNRDRSSVSKDLDVLAKAGIVQVNVCKLPGHGTMKMVSAVANRIDLRVAI